MNSETKIECPECGSKIDVNDILKHRIEDNIRREFQQEKAKNAKDLQDKQDALKKEKEELEAKREGIDELIKERLDKEKKEAEKHIEERLKAKLEEEQKDKNEALEKELAEKSEKLKESYKKDAEIAKLQRLNEEIKAAAEAETEKRISERLAEERKNIRKLEDERHEMKYREYEKKLEDQRKLTEEMKRKQEQGSTQLQGEVQELAIEEWLNEHFPLDTVDEIKKWANGADCLQTVNTRQRQNCGKIYYESKRTKNFSHKWIEKFKNDIRDKGAHIGVLVTEVMPSNMERMGLYEGIWVCTYQEFKGLSAVLRQSIIQQSMALATQENKGDKMVMLYDFLTSNEFRLQMEGIVEGFTQMQLDLVTEKNAMKRHWKKREKQIEKVVINTVNLHGSIKGIAGNAIQSVKALELDQTDSIEE